jgi:hypothetical protein
MSEPDLPCYLDPVPGFKTANHPLNRVGLVKPALAQVLFMFLE